MHDWQLRFLAKVDRSGGPDACWPWTAYRGRQGYGQFRRGIHVYRAHRLAYELAHGKIPRGLHVCHRCDNPICVNPTHLFVGTNRDNMLDKVAKCRQSRGELSGMSKLTVDEVATIRANRGFVSQRSLSELYNVGQQAISKIQLGERWRHV